MAHYTAEILWLRGTQVFLDNRYSRTHQLRFDGGATLAGSASPHVVPKPLSDASAVDPEETFLASLAGCHMLWFLSVAAKNRYCVDRYVDNPIGVMDKNPQGKLFMAVVTLKPHVEFSGDRIPSREQIADLHEQAHQECFIANSVKSDVRLEPNYG
jgi:organic hydroperoxide reductase OsmC/OhrA